MTFAEQWDDALPLEDLLRMFHCQRVLAMKPKEFDEWLRSRLTTASVLSVRRGEPR